MTEGRPTKLIYNPAALAERGYTVDDLKAIIKKDHMTKDWSKMTDKEFYAFVEEAQRPTLGAIAGQQNSVTAHMAYLARNAEASEQYWKNQAEGNKRMRASLDARPTAAELHAANPQHLQGAIGSHAQRGADDKQVSGTHYKDMPIQPWAVMEAVMERAEFIGFLKGNIIKYSLRAGRKEGSDDAGKAQHYMEKLAEMNLFGKAR